MNGVYTNPGQFNDSEVEAAAGAAHEANRAYCNSIGDTSQKPWAECPLWQKDSAISGVKFAIDNDCPAPEAMHENWLKEKVAAGWVYGETKNPEASPPTHPCILPYAELPEAQRAKDSIFRETVMRSLGVWPVQNISTGEERILPPALSAGEAVTGIVEVDPKLWQNESGALPSEAAKVDSASDDRTANNAVRHTYRVLNEQEKFYMNAVKDVGASFIRLLHAMGGTVVEGDKFASRDLSLANTHIEDAVMRAVRHITK